MDLSQIAIFLLAIYVVELLKLRKLDLILEELKKANRKE